MPTNWFMRIQSTMAKLQSPLSRQRMRPRLLEALVTGRLDAYRDDSTLADNVRFRTD